MVSEDSKPFLLTLERRADGTTTKVHYQWVENEPQDILYENGSPNSLVVLIGNLPSAEYLMVVLLPSTIPLPVVVLLVLLPSQEVSL
jgi:hypothetical protein